MTNPVQAQILSPLPQAVEVSGDLNGRTVIDCSICLCPAEIGSTATICGHIFHQACIQDWFKRSNRCPNCSTEQFAKENIPPQDEFVEFNFEAERRDLARSYQAALALQERDPSERRVFVSQNFFAHDLYPHMHPNGPLSQEFADEPARPRTLRSYCRLIGKVGGAACFGGGGMILAFCFTPAGIATGVVVMGVGAASITTACLTSELGPDDQVMA